MALGVAGVRIGTWTSPGAPTGCTVVLPPSPVDPTPAAPGAASVGAVAVRGASPGTREAVALGPAGRLDVCHAVVLAGSSAYGLAAADGAMRWLETRGVGYPTQVALVPIVGAAIVLDQGTATPDARVDADAGVAACEAARDDEPPEGAVGAGRGCTVAKVGGVEHAWRGGQGVAVREHGSLRVGALVVNNAVGEVVGGDGQRIAASRAPADAPRYPYADLIAAPHDTGRAEPDGGAGAAAGTTGPSQSTVIGCIVTNARLDKRGAWRVADLGHSGIARALHPAHTELDGDALFCLATGEVDANVDLVAAMAADTVAEAARRGPLAAVGHSGLPGLADPDAGSVPGAAPSGARA